MFEAPRTRLSGMHGSIRTRLLVSFLLVALVAAAGLSYYFLVEIEAYGLRRLEERLSSEARTTAAVLSVLYETSPIRSDGTPQIPQESLSAALADVSAETASRLRVVDRRGFLIADSAGTGSLGRSYSGRSEIVDALTGRYGAATRITEGGRVALFVAVPIRVRGTIVGASYASSTTFSIRTLLSDYRLQLALVILAYLAGTLVVAEVFVRWLSRPLSQLEAGALALAGDHSVRVVPRGPREARSLAAAFNRMAEEIEISTNELHEEERRKSRFVSDVSHELRTPLTAIRGAAETLLDETTPPEDRRRFLTTIVAESDRLARLATDLLTLQRIEGGTGELPLRRVDLRDVAAQALEALEPVAAERGVVVRLEGGSPVVLGDRDRLQQVVANLVDNATRHTPAEHSVLVSLRVEDRQAVLVVSDEGPGIPQVDLPNLFDRFYRSETSRARSSGGAGLGLAIVKAIVAAHGGTIDAANRPQGGAVFTVRLPEAGEPAVEE